MVLTLEDCKKIIYRYTNGIGRATAFKISLLGDEPLGFLGEHYKLKITYQEIKNGVKEWKFARFFLKTMPNGNQNHVQYVTEMGVFKKEALLYKNLISNFVKFHKEPIAPKCYIVQPEKFIVLEDLVSKGYSVHDIELTLPHWNSIMKTMARFHASCIIFEEQRYSTDSYRISEFYQDELKEASFVNKENHPRFKWAINTSKAVADSMKLLNNYKEGNERKLIEFVAEDIYTYTKPSLKFRNVITHADLWRNNIMFKENGDELDCVLIDFQLARYVPAAFDLLTTLHINSSSKFLDANIEHLLDLYYSTFSECLKAKNLEVDNIMSYKEFRDSLNYYKLPALVEATMFATIIFVSPELSNLILSDETIFNEFNYINKSKFVLREFKENVEFREKYSDILKRLVEVLDQTVF